MQARRFELTTSFARRVAVACLCLVAFGGCQQRLTTVSGAVTEDGKSLTIDAASRGTIVFHPDGGRGTMSTGLLDAAGKYNLATGSSIDVAPGKYFVTVSVVRLLPKMEHEEQQTKLVTPARYASARDSGLQAEVVPGENRINFDLSSNWDDERSSTTDSSATPSGASEPPPLINSTEAN
jgi:hypothetical protein